MSPETAPPPQELDKTAPVEGDVDVSVPTESAETESGVEAVVSTEVQRGLGGRALDTVARLKDAAIGYIDTPKTKDRLQRIADRGRELVVDAGTAATAAVTEAARGRYLDEAGGLKIDHLVRDAKSVKDGGGKKVISPFVSAARTAAGERIRAAGEQVLQPRQ